MRASSECQSCSFLAEVGIDEQDKNGLVKIESNAIFNDTERSVL